MGKLTNTFKSSVKVNNSYEKRRTQKLNTNKFFFKILNMGEELSGLILNRILHSQDATKNCLWTKGLKALMQNFIVEIQKVKIDKTSNTNFPT